MICPHCQKQNYNELAEVCAYCHQPMQNVVENNSQTQETYQQEVPQSVYQAPPQPVYQQPVYQQPPQPVYQQPVYQQPPQPVYQQPVYQQPPQPAYQQPVYQQPGKYCPVCGNICDPKAAVCVRCGTNLSRISTEPDVPSTGLKVLSFFIPLIGIILYAVYSSDKPQSAKAYGKMALISFCIGFGSYILLYFFIFLIAMFA